MKRAFFLLLLPLFLFGEEKRELIVLVSSKKLQYETSDCFFESLLKQGASPRVGHAWIVLCKREGEELLEWKEGGHSGEFGVIAPQYLDRLVRVAETGERENPIEILFEPLEDGIFEKGSGGNSPTYAVSLSLTEGGYKKIQDLFNETESEYHFHRWSLTQYNCVHFVLTCLGRIGIVLDAEITIPVSQVTTIGGRKLMLWKDSYFSSITLETPEKLESELRKLVTEGVAKEALEFYKRTNV